MAGTASGVLASRSPRTPVPLAERLHSASASHQTSHGQMTQAMTLVQVVVCDLLLGYRSLVGEERAVSSDRGAKSGMNPKSSVFALCFQRGVRG